VRDILKFTTTPNKNISIGFIWFLFLATSVLFFFESNVVTANANQTVPATYVEKAPRGLYDTLWDRAKGVSVKLTGKGTFTGKKTGLTVRAVYTDEEIYFRLRWKDRSRSVTLGSWRYDGQEWSRQKGKEDQIALLFEISRINNFASQGCAAVCHIPQGVMDVKDAKFGTSTAAQKADLWHWKAARSDPAGFADDSWLTVIGDEIGGRKSDGGRGGCKKNITEDKTKPKYMLGPGKQLVKRNILLAFDAEEIDDYSVFKSGDTITYCMPRIPFGSRADIKASSRHRRNRRGWAVMLARKIDTQRGDDVAFDPRKQYYFAMALFSDSSHANSYDSGVLVLRFEQ
jgi:hypothetical protein